MIDTIILRIHGIQKNNALLIELSNKNNLGYTQQTAKISKDDIYNLRKEGIKDDKEIINVLQLKRSGEFLVKTEMGKAMNASNHYAFTWYANYTKDFIEFNFSIPKFLFGTNILMFVEHDSDRDYQFYNASQLDYNLKRCPYLLLKFLEKFFKQEFIFPVDFEDIEVNRIDVCFNQVFKSKQEALLYLDYQKRLKKKYSRDEDGVVRDYATSLMYTTKRYSAKIYHKGSEYERNDKKEHLKINTEKGYAYFKVENFQSFADRILRYELTLRNTFLNYVFKHKLFRKNCKWFKMAYNIFLTVENTKQKNERISKKVGTLPTSEKEAYLKLHPYERISKEARGTSKYVSNLLNSKTFFVLKTDEHVDHFNSYTVEGRCNLARFSSELLTLCLDKLIEFIEDFKIKELPYLDIVKQKIEVYNSNHSKKLPRTEMLHFYEQLLKHGSFKEAAKYTEFSRATLYRYQSRFKLLGITTTSIKPLSEYGLPIAPMDLNDYHNEIIFNSNLLRGITIT